MPDTLYEEIQKIRTGFFLHFLVSFCWVVF